jgi:NADH-quinone oxidoreductase subunit N
MSSPVIWILSPAVLGLVLYFLRRWFRLTVTLGVAAAVVLAVLAWYLPIGIQINLGAWSFKIFDTFQILGRRLVLEEQDRTLIWIIYSMAAFWFAAVYITRAGRTTVPLGLMMVAIWLAALTVEPILYAALLVEIAVLVSIPILIQPGLPGVVIDHVLIRGGFRFLTLQTLGMAFLLLSGWALTGIETMPSREVVTQIASLLAFGLGLVLGVFPFHTWILILAEKSHPYASALVLVIFPWMGVLLGLRFLDRYPWLEQVSILIFLLRMAGVLMILIGAGSVVFERHVGRIMGCGVLIETGYCFLAVSFPESQAVIFLIILPRVVSFGVLALAMSVMQSYVGNLSLANIRGLGVQMVLISSTLVLALLSITGLPTLAYFPLRLSLLGELASQGSLLAWIGFLGSAGMLVGTLRVLLYLVSSSERTLEIKRENRQILLLAGIAIGLLFLVGLFPHWFSPLLIQGTQFFKNLIL